MEYLFRGGYVQSLRSSERGLKFTIFGSNFGSCIVAPFVGAWIEMPYLLIYDRSTIVAPFVGAWIEIMLNLYILSNYNVAPFVGAWIEMPKFLLVVKIISVAPFVGAWIEIISRHICTVKTMSLRSSERGLKLGFSIYQIATIGSLRSSERGLKLTAHLPF